MPDFFYVFATKYTYFDLTKPCQTQTARNAKMRALFVSNEPEHFLTEISGFFIMMWTVIESV